MYRENEFHREDQGLFDSLSNHKPSWASRRYEKAMASGDVLEEDTQIVSKLMDEFNLLQGKIESGVYAVNDITLFANQQNEILENLEIIYEKYFIPTK